MIAIDTNILLRRLLDDDPAQARRAHALFERFDRVLVPDVVLVEAVWTLKGKRYGASKDDIVAALTALLEEPNIVFESREAVWAALNDYAAAPPVKTSDGMASADFSDALIVRKSMVTAERLNEPYEATFTFDRAALTLPGTKGL